MFSARASVAAIVAPSVVACASLGGLTGGDGDAATSSGEPGTHGPSITFVAATQNDTESSAQISATEPAGVMPGDLLFALLSSDNVEDDAATPTGWTRECDVEETVQGSHVWCYIHVATAAEPASHAFSFQNPTDGSLIIAAYRNVASAPFDVTPVATVVTGSDSGPVTWTAPAITTTGADAMVLAMFFDTSGSGPLMGGGKLRVRATTDYLLLGDTLQASPGATGLFQVDDDSPPRTPGVTVVTALNPD